MGGQSGKATTFGFDTTVASSPFMPDAAPWQ